MLSEYEWKSTNFAKFANFNWNSRKTIQIFAKFWNSSRFWISRLWNPAKTAVVLLGHPEIFRCPIQCRPKGGGVDIFWNSPFLCYVWDRFASPGSSYLSAKLTWEVYSDRYGLGKFYIKEDVDWLNTALMKYEFYLQHPRYRVNADSTILNKLIKYWNWVREPRSKTGRMMTMAYQMYQKYSRLVLFYRYTVFPLLNAALQ